MNISMPYVLSRMLLLKAMLALGVLALLVIAVPTTGVRAEIPVAEDDFEDSQSGPTGFGWLSDWSFQDDADHSSAHPDQGSGHVRLRGRGASAVRELDVAGEVVAAFVLGAGRVDSAR